MHLMATIIDVSNHVVGRLATNLAKRLLKGEEIVLINADKAIITGGRDAILTEFKWRRFVGSERKGPYYPRMSDRILRRSIRGMLPWRRSPGKAALRRLQVFVGTPDEYAGKKTEIVKGAMKIGVQGMELGEISKVLGSTIQ